MAAVPNILRLRSDSPMRPTDWRWTKAKLLRDDPRLASITRRETDDWTSKLKRFQTQYEQASDNFDRVVLERDWPSLLQASDIHFANVPGDRQVKWEIQARLLANESLERIAERILVRPEVVIWYEKAFFNVLDRLQNRGWLTHCVLGESIQAGLTERDFDVLWKLYAIIGGIHVLEAVIDRSYKSLQPTDPAGAKPFITDDERQNLGMKSTLCARMIPMNNYNHAIIIGLHQKYQEIEKMAGAGGAGGSGSAEMVLQTVGQIITDMPWVIGPRPIIIDARDPEKIVGRLSADVIASDNLAVELRADDLLELGMGKQPPRLVEIQDYKFPEKTDVKPPA